MAGHGNAKRLLPKVIQMLDQAKLDYELVETKQRGHGIVLAKDAALAGIPIVVAAGGDGTANEVLNGLLQARQIQPSTTLLGLIGLGRGNDYSGSLGIPADLPQQIQILSNAKHKSVDVGRVTGGLVPDGRYFCNCVGVGFDTVVTIQAAKLPRWGGFLSFLAAVIKTVFLYSKGPLIHITYDGQNLSQRCLLVSVMNGRRLGGSFWMAPEAQFDDGFFDLCIAREVSQLRIFGLIPHFIKGDQATQPEITTGKLTRISMTTDEGALPAQTDGEIISYDGKSITVELFPRYIDVICP